MEKEHGFAPPSVGKAALIAAERMEAANSPARLRTLLQSCEKSGNPARPSFGAQQMAKLALENNADAGHPLQKRQL